MVPESLSAIPDLSVWDKLLLFVEVAVVLALLAVLLYFLLWRGSGDDKSGGDKDDENR